MIRKVKLFERQAHLIKTYGLKKVWDNQVFQQRLLVGMLQFSIYSQITAQFQEEGFDLDDLRLMEETFFGGENQVYLYFDVNEQHLVAVNATFSLDEKSMSLQPFYLDDNGESHNASSFREAYEKSRKEYD